MTTLCEIHGMKEIQVGDIFRMSWGYDQTNVDYFQVVRLTPKGVVVREIEHEEVPGTNKGGMSCMVRPLKDRFAKQSHWIADNNVGVSRRVNQGEKPSMSFGSRYWAFFAEPNETAFCSWYA